MLQIIYMFSCHRISECTDSDAETVMQLRSELREKEMKLTDIRLEALSSAHQLDQLRESMNRMQVSICFNKIIFHKLNVFNIKIDFDMDYVAKCLLYKQIEMERLKLENERLKMESRGSSSRAPSQVSIAPSSVGLSSQLSLTESTSLGMKDFCSLLHLLFSKI